MKTRVTFQKLLTSVNTDDLFFEDRRKDKTIKRDCGMHK